MNDSVPDRIREVRPSRQSRCVVSEDGSLLPVPDDWSLLPPGDAALSRRVKKSGSYWVVQEKRGRKVFSRGIWAPEERIARLRAELELERADPAYERRLEAGRKRRAAEQVAYAAEFEAAVLGFLRFLPEHESLARRLARAVVEHAVPVGSGTVARTERIPVAKRAEAATIAWMRHQTTAYDDMSIPRVKGLRREVRRALAERSRTLLQAYRDPRRSPPQRCPLRAALNEE